MPATPTEILLTDEDRAILDELKDYYRLTTTAETIRYAIREALVYRHRLEETSRRGTKR